MLARMLRNCITYILLVEMQNDTASLEKNMEYSSKIKHAFTIKPSNCTLRFLSQINENLYLYYSLGTHVHNTFICSNFYLKLESAQMSFSRWMEKQTVVPAHHGVAHCNEQEGTVNIQ